MSSMYQDPTQDPTKKPIPGGQAGGNMAPPIAPPTRNNFSWGVNGQGTEGVDYGNTNSWDDKQWGDYDKQYAPAAPAAPAAPTAPAAAPVAPARNNFSWGVGGQGTEGVDYGNTNNWTDKQWSEYEGRYAPAAPAAPVATSPAAPTAPAPTAPVDPAVAAPGGIAAPAAPPATVADSFKSALMTRLNKGPVDINSAELQPALQANRYAEQRGAERQREELAAQAARDGTSGSGGMDAARLGIEQDRASREGQFAGQQVGHLADREAQELTAALSQSGQYLSDQDRNALQERLAQLQRTSFQESLAQQKQLAEQDAGIREKALSQQGSLGGRELDIRNNLGEAGINASLLGMLLQNQQFGKGLAQNNTQFGQSLDQNGLLALLSGL